MGRPTAKVVTRRSNWFRTALMGSALAMAAGFAAVEARADGHAEMITSHGYSFFGDLKYPADFPHLDYVNPDAPSGGEISVWFPGTFDTFNPYARKGRAAYLADIQFETLLTGTSDDYGASYGLLAEKIEYPADKSWVIFHMRPEARFSDGTPVTAHDAVFSHNLFMEQGLPSYREAVSKRILSAEALDDLRVKFTFAPDIPRRGLIDQVGGTPVFSKKWYEETGARLDESSLVPAIGSGEYILDSYDINQQIIYKRRDDYWGNDLPINVGRGNFDRIRVEYFADSNAAFEGFKAGEYTFRTENSSRNWATGYNFPALEEGHVVRKTLDNGNVPRATGIVFNLGKEKFQDPRVREAIGLTFNFTWTNNTLQYGLFAQRESFWQNSDHAAMDLPTGLELEILQGIEGLDPAIISEPVPVPHTSGERQLDRKNLRKAQALLDEAGWLVGDDGLRRKDGQVLKMEYLESSPTFDRIMIPWVEAVKALGIDATYNRVDPAQFTNRRRDRDYDVIFGAFPMPLLPSTGLRQYFGSDSAETSVFNTAGYANPAADQVIDYIIAATDTDQVKAGARALDRILRHDRFIVPVWYLNKYWVSYFDMYEHPEELPPFALGYLDFWWHNADKEAALKADGALR